MKTIETTAKVLPEHKNDPDTFFIFMLVKSTRHWLDMAAEKRLTFLRDEIMPILAMRPEVRMRYFDVEAFSAHTSDLMLWETRDLSAWQWICDHLRESLFWDHYFEIKEILPSFEANYFAALQPHA